MNKRQWHNVPASTALQAGSAFALASNSRRPSLQAGQRGRWPYFVVTVAVLCSMAITPAVVRSAAPAGGLTPDAIRAGEARQQQIKSQTSQITFQLQAIIDEFKRNGLGGEDVKVLEAIRDVLGKLSDTEMKKVIAALQEARSVTDFNASRRSVAGAVAQQKDIVVQLRQLLLEYQRQQALHDLALRLATLAERQNGNLKHTVDLANSTSKHNRNAQNLTEDERANLMVQQAEQQAIRDEVNPVLGKIETIFKDADGVTRDRLVKAMDYVKESNVHTKLDDAVNELKASTLTLMSAAGSEMNIRNSLRDLARMVMPPRDKVTNLRQALAALEKAMDAERQIIEDTKTAKNEEINKVEPKQGDVVDKTDQIQKDLENVAADAAQDLKTAQQQMQSARTDLDNRQKEQALKNEKLALVQMEQAKQKLQEQIVNAEKAEQNKGDKLAATKELQEKVRELIKKEEQVKADTAKTDKKEEPKALAAKQDKVEKETREAQSDASEKSPPAASALADAAQQMDKAEKQIEKRDQKSAQEAQSAAVAALKQADEKLTQQAEKLEKEKKELADLTDTRKRILDLIEKQRQVELDTGRVAAKLEAQKSKESPGKAKEPAKNYMKGEVDPKAAAAAAIPPEQLPAVQAKLAEDTEQVKQALAEDEKVASDPLDSARQSMLNARGRLEAKDPKGASPAQKQAIIDLYRALESLDKRMNEIKQDLGQNNPDPNAMKDAQKQIEQLKKDVANAQQKMQNDPKTAMQNLAEQQKNIAEALKEAAKEQPKNEAIKDAQKAADQAAQEIAQGDLPKAIAKMDQAQKGIEEAQKNPQAGKPEGQKDPQAGKPEGPKDPQAGQPEGQKDPQAGKPEGQKDPQAAKPEGQKDEQGGKPDSEKDAHAGQPEGQKDAHAGSPEAKKPDLGQLGQEQADVKKAAEQMVAVQKDQQQAKPDTGIQDASKELADASKEAGQLAAEQSSQLPTGAESALQQAAQALSEAAAAAAANESGKAEQAADAAQQALSQAAASLAMAKAGLTGQGEQAKADKGQGQEPGKGEKPGQGNEPGKGDKPGQGQKPGAANEQMAKAGKGNRQDTKSNVTEGGDRRSERGAGSYITLPTRDRAAITQSQNDKYPEEYGTKIEQYLRNLSDNDEK